MEWALSVLVIFCMVLPLTAAVASSFPGGSEDDGPTQPEPVVHPVERSPLLSDDEDEIITYLEDHSIPNRGPGFTHAGPPITIHLPEVRRALELFNTGSPGLRLAIAKSLTWAPDPEIAGFWDACGPDDFEAKHYLVGAALLYSPADKRARYRQWLIEEADLKYAAALASHPLLEEYLFAGTDEEEQGKLVEFMDRWLRQLVKIGAAERLQRNVIGALHETHTAMVVVAGWVADESRNVDQRVLLQLWGKWGELVRLGLGGDDKEFFEKAAGNQSLIESWCLLSPGGGRVFFSPFKESNLLFQQSVWRQAFSDDDAVRRGALRYLCRDGGKGDSLEFIRGLDIPVAARERAVTDAREIYAELQASKEFVSKSMKSRLDKRFQALNAALEPK